MARHNRTLTRNKQVEVQSASDKKKKIVFEVRGLGGADMLNLMTDAQSGNQGELIRKTINAAVIKVVSGITTSDTDDSVSKLTGDDLIQALHLPEITELYMKINGHTSLSAAEKKTS